MKILFCKIAWMNYYQGIYNDTPIGGGQWVKEHNDAVESTNFKIYNNDTYYGYVSTKSTHGEDRQIRIEKFNGISKKDDFVEDVLVIWVSQDPEDKKHKIVGWYKHATVYRWYQFDSDGRAYNCESKLHNCILIPTNKRSFEVPQSKLNPKKFGFGSSQIWYGIGRKDDNKSQLNAKKYVDEVIQYIENYN
ncbi:hypothetical protein HCG68_00215 [Paeniclostridium sordellii]|nr:hypothetical protein [Paeniclostridium sordellii]